MSAEMKRDLTRLQSWSNDWQLRFKADKCGVMRISEKNDNSEPELRSIWEPDESCI